MLESFGEQKEQLISTDGQQFTATRRLEPGTTLFVEPSLSSVPLPSKRHQRCNFCLSKAPLQCCSRCRSAYFCGNRCFRNAWLHFHHVLCEPQETDIYVNVDLDRWLFERTALTLNSHNRMNKQQSNAPPYLAFAMQAFQETPIVCDTPPNWIASATESLQLQDISAPNDLYGRIQASSFPILDFEHHMEPVAVGLYPVTASHVRHSCRPNSAVIYKQGKQHLITIESVQPGDPITIAYVDLVNNKAQRTKELKKRFGPQYECTCIRCVGELKGIDELLEKSETPLDEEAGLELISRCIKEWSVLDMARLAERKESWSPMQTMEPPIFAHFLGKTVLPEMHAATSGDRRRQQAMKSYVIQDTEQVVKRLQVAIEALSHVPQIPAFTASAIHAAEKVLVDRIKTGKWVEASRCSMYLFVAYCLLYPPLHPKVSYHSLIFARSCWNALVELELIGIQRKLEKVYANGTRTWIEWAKVAVDLAFGRETGLWREVVELQWVFDREQKVKSSS